MSTKITDLDKFLDEIWQPYWPSHPDFERHEGTTFPESYRSYLRRKGWKRHGLMRTLDQLKSHPEWSDMVIGRIAKVGFWFPTYIDHPLVHYLRERIEEHNQ